MGRKGNPLGIGPFLNALRECLGMRPLYKDEFRLLTYSGEMKRRRARLRRLVRREEFR